MNECENLASTKIINWCDECERLKNELDCEKEKHHQEILNIRGESEMYESMYRECERENDLLEAQLKIVELIFGH